MFDIGFAELLLVSIIGLLVLGPERLPGAIRTVSLWAGRIRRSFQGMKADIERELGADEIRRQLHNESILNSLNESQQDLQDLQHKLNQELHSDLELPDTDKETPVDVEPAEAALTSQIKAPENKP